MVGWVKYGVMKYLHGPHVFVNSPFFDRSIHSTYILFWSASRLSICGWPITNIELDTVGETTETAAIHVSTLC